MDRGPYGIGTRIDLTYTRHIIEAILNDSLKNCEFNTLPVFNLNMPAKIEGIEGNTLDPAKRGNQHQNGVLQQLIWH